MDEQLNKNINRRPILHFGFSRSASTFLATKVFPTTSYELKKSENYLELGMRYLKDIKNKEIFDLQNQKDYILSCGSFFNPEIPFAWREYGRCFQKNILISNIKKFFKNNEKFLFVIRRQDKAAGSWMRYTTPYHNKEHIFLDYPFVKTGSYIMTEQGNFLSKKLGTLKNKIGVTYLHTFDYYDIISRIDTEIDKTRIKILIYEDLQYNPEKFFAELGEFIGEDLSQFVNNNKKVRNSEFDLNIIKIIQEDNPLSSVKKFIPNFVKFNIKKLFFFKRQENNKFDQEIMNLFKDGNQRLAENYDLDIKKYGYY